MGLAGPTHRHWQKGSQAALAEPLRESAASDIERVIMATTRKAMDA